MTPDVVYVKPLPDFRLEAHFANGEKRLFDMRPYLRYPAFAELADGALFMKAHVAMGTVAWTDEIDISPDTLYLRGLHVAAEPANGDRVPTGQASVAPGQASTCASPET